MEGFEEFLNLRGIHRSLNNNHTTSTAFSRHQIRVQPQDDYDMSDDEDLIAASNFVEADMVESISNDNEVQPDHDHERHDDAHAENDEQFDVRDRSNDGIEEQHMSFIEHANASEFGTNRITTGRGQVGPQAHRSIEEYTEEIRRTLQVEFSDSDGEDEAYDSISDDDTPVYTSSSSRVNRETMSCLEELDDNFKYTERKPSSVRFKYHRSHDKTNFIYSPPVKTIDRGSFVVDIEPHQELLLLKQAPAEKFYNGMELNVAGTTTLKSMRGCMQYKNNLSCVFAHDGGDYLVVACNSRLDIYDFDSMTNLPNETPRLMFDTKPTFTSTTDRVVAASPYFPHGINYVKSCQFLGKTVVCACIDDGRLLIWYVDALVEQLKRHQPSAEEVQFRNLKIPPSFKIRLSASLWGLDIKDNIIVASDNSQCIVLLYFHEQDGRFYHVKSHQLLHNIPSVAIIKHTHGAVEVSCVTIAGEVVVLDFQFKLVLGPLNKSDLEFFQHRAVYYTDPMIESLEYGNGDDEVYRHRHLDHYEDRDLISSARTVFKRVEFYPPSLLSRCVVDEDCWTIQPFRRSWFLPVGSLQSVFGDCEIDDEKECDRIIAESIVLKSKQGFQLQREGEVLQEDGKDDVIDSGTGLGSAANYQFYQCDSIDFHGVEPPVIRMPATAKMTDINDEYRRIHRDILLHEKSNKIVDDFLAVTTSKKMALFKYPSLYCPCATKPLFNLDLHKKTESCYSNRLSISAVIPELSCFIGVSQQGIVTIMRMCTYRGVYGMRQEHVFPNAFKVAATADGGSYRTIVGLSVREKKSQVGVNNGDCSTVFDSSCIDGVRASEIKDSPSYLLYILYDDGKILGYSLSE
ncbi:hypothetical protein KGF57_000679 [Candida theae]|uniref:Uncharacterized protein n=1 Tax=Candida theae TaxID=1198502 RepID=A0AAD5BIG2_9ASCO|nr:uncharacterized protein KGF57_000679 [Candida theae]KAI5966014.1 hypothetical protein KGF57_000679 [Candida theae]